MELTTLGWDGDWAHALADLDDRTLTPARVMAVHRGRLAVLGDDLDALLPVAGALQSAARSPAELPAVGDWVAVRAGEAIRHVLPRRSVIARTDEDAREEALAANVDLCIVMTSLNQDLNLRRLERFVALARARRGAGACSPSRRATSRATRSPRRRRPPPRSGSRAS